jgi:pSer/pThr/pTyr-binding forkhead associated (FHA) protein
LSAARVSVISRTGLLSVSSGHVTHADPLAGTGKQIMDDPNQITDTTGISGRGDSAGRVSAPDSVVGFFPLRLVLYPNGSAVEIKKPEVIVGRHSSADVRLILMDVSRKHCRFAFSDRHWQVDDLGSTNGLFVNGQQVERAVLKNGDLVRIGSYIFEVDLRTDSSLPPPTPAPPGVSTDPESHSDLGTSTRQRKAS